MRRNENAVCREATKLPYFSWENHGLGVWIEGIWNFQKILVEPPINSTFSMDVKRCSTPLSRTMLSTVTAQHFLCLLYLCLAISMTTARLAWWLLLAIRRIAFRVGILWRSEPQANGAPRPHYSTHQWRCQYPQRDIDKCLYTPNGIYGYIPKEIYDLFWACYIFIQLRVCLYASICPLERIKFRIQGVGRGFNLCHAIRSLSHYTHTLSSKLDSPLYQNT